MPIYNKYDEYFGYCGWRDEVISTNRYTEVLKMISQKFNTEKEKEKKDMPVDRNRVYIPAIKKVIFNNPATIVFWNDGTKTTVKCSERDEYSEEVGLAMCISKKALGNKGNFNEVFKKHIPGYRKKD